MTSVVKEGNSSFGYCYIETDGVTFYVHVGSCKYGPYGSLTDAMNEFRKWCP